MRNMAKTGLSWYDVLERHRYRVTVSCGPESRTLIVTSIAVAKQGLEPGWRVTKVDQWDPDRRCWLEVTAF